MQKAKYAKLLFICILTLIMIVISASAAFAEEKALGDDPDAIPVELGRQNEKDVVTTEPGQEVVFSYTAQEGYMVYINLRASHPAKMVLTDSDGNVVESKDSGVYIKSRQWAPQGSTFYMHITPTDGHVLCWVYISLDENEESLAPENAVASVTMGSKTDYYATFSAAVDAWCEGSTLKLLQDQEINGTINLESMSQSSDIRTLDLNDHSITQKASGQRVFFIYKPCSMDIIDSAPTKTKHYYNPATETKAGEISEKPTDYYFTGGYITGGDSTSQNPGGGGIYVEPGGSLAMTGGTIFGNHATWGGGVYVGKEKSTDTTSSFIMTGDAAIIGNISDERDRSWGFGGGLVLGYGASLRMEGGMIKHNAASSDDPEKGMDGGVAITHDASFNMRGGEISENHASGKSGGVRSCDESEIMICGNAKITGNTAGTAQSNVYLPDKKKITLVDSLSSGASIGVTMESPDVFTSGGKMTEESINGFTSDDAGYHVELEGKEAKLSVKESIPSPMTAEGKTVKIKSKTKKLKKSKTISAAKAYIIKDQIGELTYKKVNTSGKAKIAVNETTGKITLKKGLKRGVYKVNISVTDSGDEGHEGSEQTVTVKVLVK